MKTAESFDLIVIGAGSAAPKGCVPRAYVRGVRRETRHPEFGEGVKYAAQQAPAPVAVG